MEDPAKASLTHSMCATENDNSLRKKRTDYQFVNYSLVIYRPDNVIDEPDVGSRQLHHQENVTAVCYLEIMKKRSLRHVPADKKKIPI